MNLPSGWELVLVLLVLVVVFGSRRLPDSARSLGRSLRIFKAETRGLREDDEGAADRADRPVVAAAPSVPDVGLSAEDVLMSPVRQAARNNGSG